MKSGIHDDAGPGEIKYMKRKSLATHHQEDIASHAKALLQATEDIAEEKVVEARAKLSALIDRAKDGWGYIEDKAVATAEGADEFVREKPYQALGIAVFIGALVGFCYAKRK